MEYASTENLSTIGKGGKCKYGKRKYKSARVENISTETGRAILTHKWQKNITANLRKQHTQHQSMAEEIQRLQLLERCRKRPTESLRRIFDTETQSTANAAGASVAFDKQK